MTVDRHQATSVGRGRKKRRLVRPRGKRGGSKGRSRMHAKSIAQYHVLEKQIAQTTDTHARHELEAQQEALGGLSVYQDQSSTGASKLRGGESAKWCVKMLRELCEPGTRVKVLDVGAFAGTSYAKWQSWIDATYIDLNPRAAHVHQSDFFSWPIGEKYDVVGLSLVINFVGDLRQRGAYLLTGAMLLHAHNYLAPHGYVYLVLPLACVSNSRYLTHAHLREIVDSAGYDVVRQADSRKLTRWLLRQKSATEHAPLSYGHWDGRVFKKRELVRGATLNNFCIVLS